MMLKASSLAVLLISFTPFVTLDDYVYHEDPCVEALRGAMDAMEPFVPQHFKKEGDFWVDRMQLTEEGMTEREFAGQIWQEAKVQCYRH